MSTEIKTIENPSKEIQLAGGKGVQFANYSELERFAERVAASKLVPKRYERDPGSVAVCIQMGLEIGLSPMSALQNIAVINGIPTIYGDAALALVRASRLLESYKEEVIEDDANAEEGDGHFDKMGVKITIKRKGEEPHESVFTVKDARKAGLWGKAGPWKQYPKRMLMFRARGFGLRDVFPDVLMGFRTFEEARDHNPINDFGDNSIESAKNKIEEMKKAEKTDAKLP